MLSSLVSEVLVNNPFPDFLHSSAITLPSWSWSLHHMVSMISRKTLRGSLKNLVSKLKVSCSCSPRDRSPMRNSLCSSTIYSLQARSTTCSQLKILMRSSTQLGQLQRVRDLFQQRTTAWNSSTTVSAATYTCLFASLQLVMHSEAERENSQPLSTTQQSTASMIGHMKLFFLSRPSSLLTWRWRLTKSEMQLRDLCLSHSLLWTTTLDWSKSRREGMSTLHQNLSWNLLPYSKVCLQRDKPNLKRPNNSMRLVLLRLMRPKRL